MKVVRIASVIVVTLILLGIPSQKLTHSTVARSSGVWTNGNTSDERRVLFRMSNAFTLTIGMGGAATAEPRGGDPL